MPKTPPSPAAVTETDKSAPALWPDRFRYSLAPAPQSGGEVWRLRFEPGPVGLATSGAGMIAPLPVRDGAHRFLWPDAMLPPTGDVHSESVQAVEEGTGRLRSQSEQVARLTLNTPRGSADFEWRRGPVGTAVLSRIRTSRAEIEVALSAGGIAVDVRDGRPCFGLIRPRNRHYWTLPKGTLEPGEMPADAACREVQEETGAAVRILSPLQPFEYQFRSTRGGGPHLVLKGVVLYLMRVLAHGKPSAHEEIAEVAWLPFNEALARLSHNTQRVRLEQAQQLWLRGGHDDAADLA